MVNNKSLVSLFIFGLLVFALSGCVSSSKYKELEAQHQQTTGERDQLLQEKAELEANLAELESKAQKLDAHLGEKKQEVDAAQEQLDTMQAQLKAAKAELTSTSERLENTKMSLVEASEVLTAKDEALKQKEEELRKASEYMKRTNVLYDQLVGELKNELEANQVKVKEMKDGINVNLSEEILFPSGSAQLNQSGQEVITRVSKKLAGKEYQIIVVGFTDNIPIRGNLAKRYPTNWELAGARAASVVRLLESTGVESQKLVATSYGENFPVASNETEEGRAQNRRIEIRLRPVE
ncbi:MAG: OmpA family protein [Gammaproteobacteria bacterium]|jgi:chemotaxis protein MotB|nr:OmpA family protein [Gammaproteobacteria bacterium]